MSTLSVNTITNAAGGNTAQINGMTPTADSLQGFRNRILNGGMVIDQRNAGASVTPTNGQYLVDRWQATLTQASKFTVQQNAGSVTPPTGFTNYLGVTSSSAYSVASSDAFRISQQIEGFNIADFAWGTANAQAVTVSFWVQSSLTGTFGAQLLNNAGNRAYPFTYAIFSANTWEQKSITIPGDTSGTWLTNNSTGVFLGFGLGYGSSLSGTANAWNAGTAFMPTSAVSVVGTSGATFYITGVQLEAGSVATPFERRPFGTELQLCQRYCYVWGGDEAFQRVGYGFPDTANRGEALLTYPVTMRANATVSFSSASDFRVASFVSGVQTNSTATSVGAAELSKQNSRMFWGTGASFAIGTPTALLANNSLNARIYVTAEL